MKDYGKKVRVVWRNNPLPFHQNAMPAAELAMEAFAQGGSDKFWAMHDKLFENQQALSRADLEKYAQELGLDVAKFKAALDSNTHEAKIKADQAARGAKLGARGTPAFFINGRFLSGAQPRRAVQGSHRRRAQARREAQGQERRAEEPGLRDADQERPDGREGADAPQPSRPSRRQPDPKAVYKVPVGEVDRRRAPRTRS